MSAPLFKVGAAVSAHLFKVGAATIALVVPELCRYASLSIFSNDKDNANRIMKELNFESAVCVFYKSGNKTFQDGVLLSVLGALRVSTAYCCYKAFTAPTFANAAVAATLCSLQAAIGYAVR